MIRGLLYDMDGTITLPRIPWKRLRREMGVPPGETILGYLDSLPPDVRPEKEAILVAYEEEAAENAELRPGVEEVVSGARSLGIVQGLVTNNTMRSVATVTAKHGLVFDLVLTREHGRPKPAGDLLLRAVGLMGCGVTDVLFVGDSDHDAAAARAAGVPFLRLVADAAEAPPAARTVRRFAEILGAAGAGVAR